MRKSLLLLPKGRCLPWLLMLQFLRLLMPRLMPLLLPLLLLQVPGFKSAQQRLQGSLDYGGQHGQRRLCRRCVGFPSPDLGLSFALGPSFEADVAHVEDDVDTGAVQTKADATQPESDDNTEAAA
ncbi:hypothetical protein MRB53_001783 [Persea americana]|uniref:Uncharacterized protein n=1 Tax=Persea americana TaxID=3435 RepID=A0ACC2MSP8_PERAE|nr:hypothetical protein MRB53_001783 [Persea americana]